MKISIIILMLLVLSSISLVVATSTDNTDLEIRVFNNTDKSNTIEIISNEYTIVSGNYIGKNYTSIFNFSFDSTLGLIFAVESSNKSLQDKYIQCVEEKAACLLQKGQFDTAWSRCNLDLNKCEDNDNSTVGYKNELDACNLKIRQKDIDITTKNDEISDLNENKDDTRNVKWFYAIIALAIGYAGRMFQKGELGAGAREKARDEYNPQQAA